MTKKRKRRKLVTVFEQGVPIRNLGRGRKPWQVDFARGLQRERKCYETESAAREHAARLKGKVRREGADALTITAGQRDDAKRALDLLRGRATLEAAARAYLKLNPDHGAKRVWRAMGEYLRYLRKEGRRPLTIKDKRWKFAAMLPEFGRRAVESVTPADLKAWADAQGYTGATARNYLRAGANLLNFAQGKLKVKQAGTRRDVVTWPLATVEAWLRKAEELTPEGMPTWALLFFCGLRPYEAARLQWEAIDLQRRLVRVDASISKVGESRLVEIPGNAAAWLAKHWPTVARGPMVRGRNPESTVRNWRLRVKAAMGVTDYPVDVTRHTFATAHFEAHGDAGKTAKELGHFGSLQTFRVHYKGLMPHEDALAYWKIMPSDKGNMLHLRASA